ncbi:MAG: undecaprenyl-phosphate glucose phosphotransferase [Blautia sp.]|nr:undecaprenyl-phosphate glucose phosphotransferase [Blautia sp.]MDD5966659.1 undecaprenyl-phosphate glucose phosphotransferase [Blautia sp.]MDY2896505.1 undecaprenyl-phosphate glucose phosphotransferase [Candidatus Limivivens sp.]
MIKDNERFFYRIHVVIDAFVIALSYLFACFLQLGFFIQKDIGRLTTEEYLLPLFFVVPGLLLLYYAFNLYTSKRIQGRRLEIGNIVKANSLMLLIFLSVLMLSHMDDFSRQLVFLFYGIDTVLEVIVRFLIRYVLVRMRKNGMNLKRILLVGYSRAAEEYIDRINSNPQWGYVVRGILDDSIERGTMYKGVKVIGRIDNLLVILPQNHLDEIAITLGLNEYYKLERIVGLCEKSGVHTKFIPDYNNIIPTKPYTEDLLGLPVINIRHVPLSNTFNMMVKRCMDVCGSLAAIVVFSPVMLLMVLLIKLTSPGPLIFKQERVGLHNRPFQMYKFRSMEVQKERDEQKCWTVKNDPRVTGIGKFMRKTSIDELPQLFNVLKGDMSLVGPRPERPQFVEKFREEIPRYMVKHQVRPGMTGWAQINGYRGDTSIRKRIEYDLYYIENWTVGLDLKILFLTFFKGFINKNAY